MSLVQPDWSDLLGREGNAFPLSRIFLPTPQSVVEALLEDPSALRVQLPQNKLLNPSAAKWHRVYDGRVGRTVYVLCFNHDL